MQECWSPTTSLGARLPGLMTTGLALSPAPSIDEQSGVMRRAALPHSMLLHSRQVIVMVLPCSLFWCLLTDTW